MTIPIEFNWKCWLHMQLWVDEHQITTRGSVLTVKITLRWITDLMTELVPPWTFCRLTFVEYFEVNYLVHKFQIHKFRLEVWVWLRGHSRTIRSPEDEHAVLPLFNWGDLHPDAHFFQNSLGVYGVHGVRKCQTQVWLSSTQPRVLWRANQSHTKPV